MCQVLLGTWDTEMKKHCLFLRKLQISRKMDNKQQLKYNVIDSLIKKSTKHCEIRESEKLV